MENSRRRFHCMPHVSHPGHGGSHLLTLEVPSTGSISTKRWFIFSDLHCPFSENHKGVSHLSPWRSYPTGSSFSSFSILREIILRPPRRCDNPICELLLMCATMGCIDLRTQGCMPTCQVTWYNISHVWDVATKARSTPRGEWPTWRAGRPLRQSIDLTPKSPIRTLPTTRG